MLGFVLIVIDVGRHSRFESYNNAHSLVSELELCVRTHSLVVNHYSLVTDLE